MAVVMDRQTPTYLQYKRAIYFYLITKKNIQQFVLPVNPEELTDTGHNRIEVTQTLGGAYVNQWGEGIGTLNLRGTTGYKRSRLNNMDGAESIRALRYIVYEGYHNAIAEATNPDDVMLIVANTVDQTVYRVVPIGEPKFLRNKARPMFYQYDLLFQIIPTNLIMVTDEDEVQSIVSEDKRLVTIKSEMRQIKTDAAIDDQLLMSTESRSFTNENPELLLANRLVSLTTGLIDE